MISALFGLSGVSNRQSLIPDAVGHIVLAHLGQGSGTVFGNQGHDVGIHAKARALGGNVVGYDQIQVFGLQLLLRVGQHVLRLGGKTHQHLAGLFALYALCRTDVFDRAASVSGSWPNSCSPQGRSSSAMGHSSWLFLS